MFIEKAARRRIPREQAPRGELPALKELPLESGWLTDNTLITPARYPAAPYADYTGDPSMAFWHLDEELAKANQVYGTRDRGKKPQTISFDDIPDQQTGAGRIPLRATSDAGLPVRFCVIRDPATVEGDKLRITKLPPRAKFPVRVTVIAYQWGRSVEPRVQSAGPTEQTFRITR